MFHVRGQEIDFSEVDLGVWGITDGQKKLRKERCKKFFKVMDLIKTNKLGKVGLPVSEPVRNYESLNCKPV